MDTVPAQANMMMIKNTVNIENDNDTKTIDTNTFIAPSPASSNRKDRDQNNVVEMQPFQGNRIERTDKRDVNEVMETIAVSSDTSFSADNYLPNAASDIDETKTALELSVDAGANFPDKERKANEIHDSKKEEVLNERIKTTPNKYMSLEKDSLDNYVCYVCYKSTEYGEHTHHSVEFPLACMCTASFNCMEDLMKHKHSCLSHLKMLQNLQKFSCLPCKLPLKTKQSASEHLKSAKHKQRMIVVSPTTPMSISNTVDHKNKSVDEMGEKSTTVKTNMLASRYNTRKSLRKANRKDEFDYVDMVRKPIKRSSIKDKMKSDNDVQRLVEDVKKACTKLKAIGKDFLLIIPDEIEPTVMGSERSLQFAIMNKTFIEQYSTFSTGKRSPQSKGLKSRKKGSNKKFKFSNMKNVPEGSLTTKSGKDHLVFKRNVSMRKEAKVNLKERDNKSNNCRRSPQKQPDIHYRNTENVQNEGQKGAIDDELEMVGTPPRIRDNLPPVSDIHEALSDDDVEDVTVDASEDVSSEDEDNNNEQPNIKLKLKSKLKGSKELLKKWSDLEYGTAKHVVKQVDIDENKYVAVKDNEELHICQKCGLYFMNAHHLKSHQLRVVNCEKRILNVPQTSLDPLTSAVTIPNDERKTEDKVTLQELINLQKSVPFECVICKKTFVTKSRLTRHMRTHSDISPYTCGICGTQIKTEEGFGVHLTSHFNRPFDCENCDHKFSSLANLEQHKTKSCLHTRRVIGLDVGKPGLTEDLTCDLCSFQAVDMTALALHKSKHTPTNATACFLCKKTVNKAHMKRHIILMHQESKPFQCEVCDKMYKDRVSLQRHIKIHDNKKYTCKVCNRVFTTKSYLTHHMHTHEDIKKYVCQHCGEAYKKKHYLDNHVRLHTGERPFACNVEGCEKSFRSKSNLNQHKRTHNEVGQFVCDICGRTFKQPGQLIFHRKSHSNEYRWPCTYCPEKFKSCWMYKRHLVQSHSEKKEEIESTTNIRLHKCTICGKLYHDTEDLQRHINNHKGVKPFTCSFCNKGFSCKSNLRTHEHGHKGTYKLKCKICYKTFLHEQNLVSHIERVHQKLHEEASEDDITNITAFSAENEQATFYIEFNDLETQANDLHVLNAEES